MKQQSELLTAFYRAYLAWAETGDNLYGFRNTNGLCSSLVKFLDISGSEDYTIYDEMQNQFIKSGLDFCYPFNDGEDWQYYDEMKNHKATSNIQRMNWVIGHAQ